MPNETNNASTNDANVPTGAVPTPDPYFCDHYVTTDAENRIVSLFSLTKVTDPPEGAIFLHEGLTLPRLFPDGIDNPNLTEPVAYGAVFLYEWDGEKPVLRSGEEKAADAAKLKALGEKKARINALKQMLSGTDYKTRKYVDGEISPEDYEPIKELAKAWRPEINELEEEIAPE